MSLEWAPTKSFIVPCASTDGRYQVVTRVGGRMGPVYQAQCIVGLGIAQDIGQPCDLVEDAQAYAENDAADLIEQRR